MFTKTSVERCCCTSCADAVVDLVPKFIAGNGPKLLTRDFDRQVHLALMADIDDHRIRTMIAGKKMGHGFDRFLRGGKTNAYRTIYRSAHPGVRAKV